MADHVIVGAGSAGCVLTEALSARHSVVVLEAGSEKLPYEVSIPAAFSKLFKTSSGNTNAPTMMIASRAAGLITAS